MRYGLAFLGIFSVILVGACDGGDDGTGPGSDAVADACEKYCGAILAEPCGELQVTPAQCSAQCTYFAEQLLGVCEAEYVDAFECLGATTYTCMGYDTDQDGVDDAFSPVPEDQCLPQQQAQITCEQTAGCQRFCKTADGAGCGGGCLEACDARVSELDSGGFSCGYGYHALAGCSARYTLECKDGKPAMAPECVETAFSIGECVNGDADMCATYCFGSQEVGCGGSDCATDCASRSQDAACGQAWQEVLDCMLFFGDAVCTAGLLVPDPNGICDYERQAYLDCAGSF